MSCACRVFRGCRFVLAPRPKSSSSSSAATVEIEKKAKSSGGLFKPTPVSPALRSFLDVSESSRADAVKQIWSHIKLHNLQGSEKLSKMDPYFYWTGVISLIGGKGISYVTINPSLFEGKERVNVLEVGKLLSRHFVKTNRL